MAYTNFIKPTSVTQNTGATEITWDLDSSPFNISTGSGSQSPLTSTDSKNTGLLIYSGWDTSSIPNASTINGIEVKVFSNKDARIKDSIIQLAQSGAVIGSNKANADAGEIYTYGTSTNLWGATLSYSDLSTLQVALKYKPTSTPHRDHCYVYSVQLKIHYT